MPEEKKDKPVQNYTGNSHKGKADEAKPVERIKIDAVIEGKVITRKKGLWRKFSDHVTGEDAKSVGSYVLWDIAIPAFRDLIFDVIKSGAERSLYPDSRPSSRDRERRGERSSRIQYDKKFVSREDPRDRVRDLSPRARRNHDFGEIVLETRLEVERVLDGLTGLIDEYDFASLNDLYDLLSVTGTPVDERWGWTNLSSARAVRVRDGWLLDLPAPEPID